MAKPRTSGPGASAPTEPPLTAIPRIRAALEGSTLPPESLTLHPRDGEAAERLALVVLWCRDEPARAGEVLLIPPGSPWIFGRGDVAAGERRLGLVRQRPSGVEPTGPLLCPRISREQLELSVSVSGLPVITSTGRCPLVHEGSEVKHASPAPGDLLELKNELLFLCVRRPAEIPRPRGAADEPATPFGAPDTSGILGESPAIWALRAQIAAVARLATHVLVLGPSGSGKELVARAAHRLSPRGRRPLVARNAATIPEGLADAELFGNLRNYPNPGTPDRPGLVGEADGSTLFLDELGELPTALQARLLRVLDEGEYQRLGESTSRRTDLRLIAATNRPADALKHDVLARFSTRIHVPDLNARREDIPLLAAHLLRRHAAADPEIAARFFPGGVAAHPPRLSPALVAALVRHTYTTHVRELDALLVQAALESAGKYLDLTPGVDRALSRRGTAAPKAGGDALSGDALSAEERRCLDLLRKHGFHATRAGRDPDYPGNRQTADLHLRKLLCKALKMEGWSVRGAAAFLAGEAGAAAQARLEGRIETFLQNLEKRIQRASEAEAGDPDEALARSLADEWSGSVRVVLDVARALRLRQIHGLTRDTT